MSELKKEVKILYGIRTKQIEGIKAQVRDFLKEYEVTVASEEHRDIKSGILYEISTNYSHDEPVVLVASYRLQSNEPFTVSEIKNFQSVNKNIRIILIVADEDKRAGVFNNLYAAGIYDGLGGKDATTENIAKLVAQGRTAIEARNYYGIVDDNAFAERFTVDDAYQIVTSLSPLTEENVLKAIEWIESRLNETEFGALLNKLPDEIKDILCKCEKYAGYYADYINQSVDALRNNGSPQPKSEEIADCYYSQSKEKLDTERQLMLMNAVRDCTIGVAGAQKHIGSTHNAISIAHYLSEKRFHVAVVEYSGQEDLAIVEMAKVNGFGNGKFTWKGVDYYPNMNFEDLAYLKKENYNFIVIDFGLLTKEKRKDFTFCASQCIVTGSRVWDTKKLDDIFAMVSKDILTSCNFLFYSTPLSAKKGILKNMEPLNRIFFIGYDLDPFDGQTSDGIEELLKNWVLSKRPPKKKPLFGRREDE